MTLHAWSWHLNCRLPLAPPDARILLGAMGTVGLLGVTDGRLGGARVACVHVACQLAINVVDEQHYRLGQAPDLAEVARPDVGGRAHLLVHLSFTRPRLTHDRPP